MKTFSLLLRQHMTSTGIYLPGDKNNALRHGLEVLKGLIQVQVIKFFLHCLLHPPTGVH